MRARDSGVAPRAFPAGPMTVVSPMSHTPMRRADELAMRYLDGELSWPSTIAYRARLLLSPDRRAELAEWRALNAAFRDLRGVRSDGPAP